MDDILQWSKQQAETLLPPLGNRWLHVQGVVRHAYQIAEIFSPEDQIYLIASAYLHDIAYAPSLYQTDFHPIDGAIYLRSCNQERLASLVAYHSGAQFEAHLRGLTEQLAAFRWEDSLVADALAYCDLTTNPLGQRISFEERLADVTCRYGQEHLVSQAIHQASPFLAEIVQRVQDELRWRGIVDKQAG